MGAWRRLKPSPDAPSDPPFAHACAMLDDRLVYGRTPQGEEQISGLRQPLQQGARRILRLLDGRRALMDLAPLARPGDLERIVEHLLTEGLIELIGIVNTPGPEEIRAMEREQRAQLDRLQQILAGAFEQELGADGLVLDARIQDCVNLDVMRRVLRETVDTLARRGGNESAERVLVKVRPLFADYAKAMTARPHGEISRL